MGPSAAVLPRFPRGCAWIYRDAQVFGDAQVFDGAQVRGDFRAGDYVLIAGTPRCPATIW